MIFEVIPSEYALLVPCEAADPYDMSQYDIMCSVWVLILSEVVFGLLVAIPSIIRILGHLVTLQILADFLFAS